MGAVSNRIWMGVLLIFDCETDADVLRLVSMPGYSVDEDRSRK